MVTDGTSSTEQQQQCEVTAVQGDLDVEADMVCPLVTPLQSELWHTSSQIMFEVDDDLCGLNNYAPSAQ